MLVLLPFLGMPFTIDDVTFLLQAKHVLVDPLHPTAFEMIADAHRIRLSQQLVSGPVMAYLLIPSVLLGGAEWAAHIIQLILVVVSCLATSRLALRLGLDRRGATITTLLVVVSPAVLGMATTGMPDIAAMAFAVLGIERYLASLEEKNLLAGASASVCLAIAALARPHAILTIPCAVFLGIAFLMTRTGSLSGLRSSIVRLAAPAVGAFVIWGVVTWIMRDPQSGQTVVATTAERINRKKLYTNVAGFFLNWVAAFPLGLLWPMLRSRGYANTARTFAAFMIALIPVRKGVYAEFAWWLVIIAIAWTGLGIDIFFDSLIDGWKRKDWTQIALLSWMSIAAPTVFYVHVPPKALVPAAPAMAIMLARAFRRSDATSRYRSLLASSTICVALGVLIILAEARFAFAGREAARTAGALMRQGHRVWVDGSWGVEWYGMQEGAEVMATTAPFPKAGDLVVQSLGGVEVERFPDRTRLSARIFDGIGGIVQGQGAGFFSNGGGPLPWKLTDKEIARIEVWRIESDRRTQ